MPIIRKLSEDERQEALQHLGELCGALEHVNRMTLEALIVLARSTGGATAEARARMAIERGRARGLAALEDVLERGQGEALAALFAEAFG